MNDGLTKHQRYRKKHREALKIRSHERYLRTKHTPSAKARRKRAKVKRRTLLEIAIVDLTASQWARILQAYNRCCAYCGESKDITQDHVLPISRGGNHTAANIVPACMDCNRRKHAAYAPDALYLNPYAQVAA